MVTVNILVYIFPNCIFFLCKNITSFGKSKKERQKDMILRCHVPWVTAVMWPYF